MPRKTMHGNDTLSQLLALVLTGSSSHESAPEGHSNDIVDKLELHFWVYFILYTSSHNSTSNSSMGKEDNRDLFALP